MNATLVAVLAFFAYLLAYFVYGRRLARRILGFEPDRPTPAHVKQDGVDYVPSNRLVLFGHHFATIAGLGPILGPAIAVIWGWVPALLWVLFGSIFMGAVHDLTALYISLRNEGRSIGTVTDQLLGARGRVLFLLLIFFLLALAMGAFAHVIAVLFSGAFYPEAVFPVWALIVIALAIGALVYRLRANLTVATLVGVALMLLATWHGTGHPVTRLPLLGAVELNHWVWILMAYALVASVLPVWLLLQPRDYLNSFQLYLGMGLLFLGLFAARPDIVAPAVNRLPADLPPLFPFLFITIACGAISGFHSLVSSGTTAKQLASERDSLFVTYGAMLTESLLAVLAILACTAGFASRAEWHAHYASWAGAEGMGPKLQAFVQGGANLCATLGLDPTLAAVFIAVVVVGFAMTTLDSGTRLLRYNLEELGHGFAPLGLLTRNRYAAGLLAVLAIGYFAVAKVGGKPAGITLWALFGITNQLLGALGFLVMTLWFYKAGRPFLFLLLPMVFMMAITLVALPYSLWKFLLADPVSWPLLITGLAILVLDLWLIVEAFLSLRRLSEARRSRLAAPAA
ncbi:MAG: carbon starvation protein A [Candidatus Krumholzibacteriota bacterium]|nr:carbon starvation protein A [Candidatus Krumholzibacteriota bacterium]